ncbi:RNA polymerase sigma factor [Desulfosarcina ovata subsp. sediminis]|uniref:RNA polymerase sigma factor n=1 Tax=Desulfosarcina ovata subsp. sediminis TaxID=885957 RepID=A0A5K7ZYH4_9BACT|nr:sigma-70 family RNA polymerase sigma factor [Desulfosarcina ovata]BBO85298.1 RNA polymerase sigma factor [Desulfosarcina ovata subsp. sediminis]
MKNGANFYNQNKGRLYAYLLRMTGDTHMATELVQESFVRYLGRYGEQESRTLLYTIARNAALDALRKKRADPMADVDAHPDPAGDPEQQMIDREALARMLAAIGKLAPVERELISLVVTADLTYREIARVLNLSEANVKVKVHRARTRLRGILGSGGG